MSAFLGFLAQVVLVSLSGVMAPGPMTAVTLAAGTRNRHAGIVMALGHGVVEFPLMILIMMGMGRFFQIDGVKIGLGFFGGMFLAFLGIQMLREARKNFELKAQTTSRGDFLTAIVMTGGNAYFLLWWATVGLNLTTEVLTYGMLAFGIFAVTHWLCDLVWLEVLSLASHRGSQWLKANNQRILLMICGGAMLFFAGKFIWDAAARLLTAP